MKIVFTSYHFSPSVGGMETVAALLAPEFVKAGHELVLVTKTKGDDHLDRSFQVVRNPDAARLLDLTRWCDVFAQNNISLELAWPLLFIRRPWVISHQTFLNHLEGPIPWRSTLKNYLLRFASNASISESLGKVIPVPASLVGNPYSADIFKLRPEVARTRQLVYLGRLVSDKGIHFLIEALAELRRRDLKPGLTIIGSGPELDNLRATAHRLGLDEQINFTGSKKGVELAELLNAHQIMVIPSQWPEPFGIVALEGIACGCAVLASQTGGLPDAVGPCGLMFEPGNYLALSDALENALRRPDFRKEAQREAARHLAQFAPAEVAARYLKLFHEALAKK